MYRCIYDYISDYILVCIKIRSLNPLHKLDAFPTISSRTELEYQVVGLNKPMDKNRVRPR